jgi:kelch-like protein 17 (actinfilin)
MVFVLSGHNGSFLSSVIKFDTNLGAWTTVAPMATGRAQHGTFVLNGCIYAVGGLDENRIALASMEKYDPATDSWSAVKPMHQARKRLGVESMKVEVNLFDSLIAKAVTRRGEAGDEL